MKKMLNYLLLIALTFLLSPVIAGVSTQTHSLLPEQDTIMLKNGKMLIVKSIQLSEKGIKYKQYDSSPYSFLSNKQLSSINYGNGKRDTFIDGKRAVREGANAILSPKEIACEQAQKDIKKYKPVGAFFITFLFNFFTSPVIGLLPVAFYLSKTPKDKDTKLPDNADADYKDCYRSLAKKKRINVVWSGYILAALSVLAAMIIIALISSL